MKLAVSFSNVLILAVVFCLIFPDSSLVQAKCCKCPKVAGVTGGDDHGSDGGGHQGMGGHGGGGHDMSGHSKGDRGQPGSPKDTVEKVDGAVAAHQAVENVFPAIPGDKVA